MAAGLPLVLGAVLTLFAVFAASLFYAQWATRSMEVHRAK